MSAKSSHPATKLSDHIRELVMRLVFSSVALMVSGTIVYFFYDPLIELLRSPLGKTLYYSTPAGSFSFVMKICFMGALVISTPILAYNLIMFVRPAFEKLLSLKRVYSIVITSSVLSVAGALFAFIFILPGTLQFFSGFQTGGVNALISADSYLNFVTNVIITFVIMFQIPLLVSFIDKIKPLNPRKMLKMEKWVAVGSIVISLILPFSYDLLTSLLVSLPMIALFNLSIIVVLIQHAHKKQKISKKHVVQVIQPAFKLDPDFDPSEMVNGLADKTEMLSPSKLMPTPQKRRTSMDFFCQNKNLKVQTNQTVTKQVAQNTKSRLISDISRSKHVNRVLASQ